MKFKGREYNTITQEIPSTVCSLEDFLRDWQESNVEMESSRIDFYKKNVLIPIYNEYVGLMNLVDEDNFLEEEQKVGIKSRLNQAMGIFQGIGSRSDENIILSLQSQKYGKTWPDKDFQERFDSIVDMLTDTFSKSVNQSNTSPL